MAVSEMKVRTFPATGKSDAARMPNWLKWGALIGLVQIFAIATVAPLGVSTAYPQFVGLVLDRLFPGFAAQQLYLREIGTGVTWEVMLLAGLFTGALLSFLLGRMKGGLHSQPAVAPVCVTGFEGSRMRRYVRAWLGGFLFIFGARLAGGCTTGHMLSGMAQMAISGLVFGAVAFGTGMLFAKLLFREPSR
ncbi:MAG: YeeE/YedE thiosulfate transporter family protein [Acidobacteriota bacterium]|nr:YeeE/YedE family protein [Blastocatellia bacterium]MDW8239905.1 YeeE/YedE thiosulfate transporter family protein [Acidobacteriota bacterium]